NMKFDSLMEEMGFNEKNYPLGNQTFEKIITDGKYYVDKTALIYRMTHSYNYVFLSRPRRFGKSLLCSTLASYFRGEKELFQGLAMERLEKDWKRYPVIHLSLASVKSDDPSEIKDLIDDKLELIEDGFGIPSKTGDLGRRLNNIILGCHKKFGEKVVVILDEYDDPLLNVLHEPDKLKIVRQIMRTLFSPLKDCDPYLRFLFITGITKFSQLSIFSEINNLTLVSMDDEYSTLCGFTQQELETVFTDGIDALATKKGLSREQTLDELRQTYDGYHFSAESPGVYNPYSIVNALSDGDTKNYWFATRTPTFLVNTLKEFHTDIADVDGSEASVEEFDAPTENMHSVLPLFYQSGYLTIKDYDPEFSIYTLGYPNKEVRTGLLNALYPFYVTANTDGKSDTLRSIVKGFRNHDLDQVFQTLQAFLEGIPYQDSHFDENHWTQMLYVVFSLLGIYTESQVRTAKGRIDIVVKTADDIYVMEVKLDHPAQEALEQIDAKSYLVPYTLDGRRLTKIGMTFSTEQRNVTEWMVG
ncbi:MAG: ATP-binding protein, partial [Bacteroidaceae bacterium]|nr:ATP-binding protein [Bacteroidaceae bacterium]